MLRAKALARTATADFFVTVLWATVVSATGYCMALLYPLHQDDDNLELVIVIVIAVLQLVLFGVLGEVMGGASFNPLANIANYVASVGNESATSLLLRIPAQTGGMLLGAWLTWHYVVPHTHRHSLAGPSLAPGIDVATGALAEFGLTFALNVVVLWVLFAGPKSSASKALILLPCTVAAILAGASFTGPSMNPIFAFSWAFHHGRHNNAEHFVVYWLAPTLGAVLAALVYRWLVRPLTRRPKPATQQAAEAAVKKIA